MVADFLQVLDGWDSQALLAVNGLHNSFWDIFMYTYSGKLIWVPMYAALVYVLFRNFSWKMALACLVGVGVTILLADQVGASLIRPWVERMRPSNPDNPLSEYVHLVNGYRGGRYGFPSCHAANTFGLAFFLMYLIRRSGFTCFLMLWALLTCYSRAYLGVHYPGDLLVGALLGGCCATLVYAVLVRLCRYRRPSRFKGLWVPVALCLLTVAGICGYCLARMN